LHQQSGSNYPLKSIADYFLVHNRDILVRCDDSLLCHRGGPQLMRRSRGYVPGLFS